MSKPKREKYASYFHHLIDSIYNNQEFLEFDEMLTEENERPPKKTNEQNIFLENNQEQESEKRLSELKKKKVGRETLEQYKQRKKRQKQQAEKKDNERQSAKDEKNKSQQEKQSKSIFGGIFNFFGGQSNPEKEDKEKEQKEGKLSNDQLKEKRFKTEQTEQKQNKLNRSKQQEEYLVPIGELHPYENKKQKRPQSKTKAKTEQSDQQQGNKLLKEKQRTLPNAKSQQKMKDIKAEDVKLPLVNSRLRVEYTGKQSNVLDKKVDVYPVNSKYEAISLKNNKPQRVSSLPKYKKQHNYEDHQLRNVKIDQTVLKKTVEDITQTAKFKYLRRKYGHAK